jgi:hypothetical protein
LIIEFEGRSWQYDEDKVSVQQAITLHLTYGLTISAWQLGVAELDPRALQFCYWLMLQQGGVKKPLKDLDFAVIEFIEAYRGAQDARDAEEAEAESAEPDPTPPSPPEDPPSTGPSTPTATTPTPHARRPATTGS